MKWIAFVTAASLLGFGAVGHAQTSSSGSPTATQEQHSSASASQQTLVSHDSIVGANVRDQQGQDLGRIDQLFVDAQSGRIAYAVVARGGVFGMGQDQVQVPWDKVSVRQDGGNVVLVMDQTALRDAPRFDGGSAPAASPETAPRENMDRSGTPGSQPQQDQQPATQPQR
jgi:sporulation protein YlmC with PRC-barrel domain